MVPLRNAFSILLAVLATRMVVAETTTAVTRPFRGMTLIARSETSPRNVQLNVVLVDLTAPGIAFKLTSPGGGRDTVRQTTLDFLIQEKAQIAINVHFFVPFPSEETDVDLVGLAASHGNVYSPFEGQPVRSGFVDQSYAIVSFAPALNLDSANRVTLVRRDPAQADNRRGLPDVTLWNAFSGSAQIVADGAKTIPRYSGAPDGLNPARGYSDANSWYALPRARTAAGVTSDQKTLVLFTADQSASSGGMTVTEVADRLIKDYQVAQALNLDGGGSTTLAMQDPKTLKARIVNTPTENPRGRAVGSSLAVFAQPSPP